MNGESSKVLMIKAVLLGDAAVGKTSLVQRFVRESFGGRYQATMGLDLSIKEVVLPQGTVRLQLWDMGGQLAFKTIRLRFYGGTRGALLVYDTTRPKTFQNLQLWLQELEDNVNYPVPFIVLGNKSDLGDMCVISEEEEEKWASKVNAIANFRTSAKTGDNVEDAFHCLGEKVLTEIMQREQVDNGSQISQRSVWNDRLRL
ncbi:MAG: Rab family GTPase [Promethearchaeota archaeon]